jgi:hypothetical protein
MHRAWPARVLGSRRDGLGTLGMAQGLTPSGMAANKKHGGAIRDGKLWCSAQGCGCVPGGPCVTVAAFMLWLRAPPDPIYNGKRLSQHLSDPSFPAFIFAPGTNPNITLVQAMVERYSQAQQERALALNALGLEAMPLLGAWLQSDSALRRKLRDAASRPGSNLRWLSRCQWLMLDRRTLAYDAARLIPQHGAPLIPILRKEILAQKAPGTFAAAALLEPILEALPPEQRDRVMRENAALTAPLASCIPNEQSQLFDRADFSAAVPR